jgi:RNA polymerase sigma factor for flagellar operon FliA
VLGELRSRDILSRTNRRKVKELETAITRLEQKLGREPTDEEVSTETGFKIDEIDNIKKIAGLTLISLDEIGYSDSQQRPQLMKFLTDKSDDPQTLTKLKELKSALAASIESLKEKEKLVVSLYYIEELTMREIGDVLDITESRVSQIHSKAIFNLRKKLRKEGLLD